MSAKQDLTIELGLAYLTKRHLQPLVQICLKGLFLSVVSHSTSPGTILLLMIYLLFLVAKISVMTQ